MCEAFGAAAKVDPNAGPQEPRWPREASPVSLRAAQSKYCMRTMSASRRSITMPATRSTAMHHMVRPASVGRVGPPSRCPHRKGWFCWTAACPIDLRPPRLPEPIVTNDKTCSPHSLPPRTPLGWSGTIPASASAAASWSGLATSSHGSWRSAAAGSGSWTEVDRMALHHESAPVAAGSMKNQSRGHRCRVSDSDRRLVGRPRLRGGDRLPPRCYGRHTRSAVRPAADAPFASARTGSPPP